MRRIFLLVLLFAAGLATARDKPENWVEVSSPHFVVATNAGEKQGRRIADQFEKMRSVFHLAFPKMQIDPGSPVIVLAIKDDKDFRALEPEAYLAKGQVRLGGLFLHAPDKNYVLMRIDAEGDHPYEVIYHEYTHLILGKAAEWMPLWLNEGLAEFYQNTVIHDKDVALGEPSRENILLLRERQLLPVSTLFTVDEKSPYYHEENKGSIFYAQSWALTHYILIQDRKDSKQRLTQYTELLTQKVDPVTAATRAFGDLKQLQGTLETYIHQGSFTYYKMLATTDVDDAAFKLQTLTPAQADAVQADFLAYEERIKDARALLDHVLQEDPNNVSAHETMGFLEFRQGHLDEAKKWYTQAVQFDSQSYLAHYYFAAMTMNGPFETSQDAQVEASLRAAIRLNPAFAPTYDRLAVFLATRHRDLQEARTMGLTAISLDPGNVGYRINMSNILMHMQQGQNAIQVLRAAAKVAKSPQDSAEVENALMNAQTYVSAQEDAKAESELLDSGDKPTEERVPRNARPDKFVPSGAHRFLVGVLRNIRCDATQIDFAVESGGKALALHAENYYKINFSALNFQPRGDLNPCRDLEGRPAKVEYVESADKAAVARVLSIEMHK